MIHHPRVARALGPVARRLRDALAHVPGASAGGLAVAWSGGADSGALLGLAELALRRTGPPIHVLHVDHGLRPESGAEAQLVLAHACGRGLPCEVLRLELAPGAGLATRARDARRQALLAAARRRGCGVLALGHTATDQAETVLLNLARGADLRGMGGMRELDPRTDPPLVRPLLGLVREETREVARLLRVPFVDDPGNEDVRSPRVRVRRQILPALGSGGPAVVRAIGAAALAAQAAEEALASHDAGGALDAPQGDAPRADTLPPDALPNGPRALRLRHLRERCGAQGVDLAELRRSVLGEVEQALARGTHGQWDVHPRRRIRVRAGRFWVEPPNH